MRGVAVASLVALALAVPSASAAPPQRFLLTLARDIRGHQPPRLVLVDRSGALVRQIGTAGYVAVNGEWSPNGQSIAWSDPGGVHVEDADGTDARLLVPHETGCNTACGQPSFIWTPDGTGLDVGGAGPQTNEFLYVPIDGSPPSALTPTRPWTFAGPVEWTSGGRSLIWVSSGGKPGTAGCCHFSVFETVAATHATRTLFTGPSQGVQGPAFSPSGRQRIMFDETSNPKDDYRLRIVDDATGKSHVLVASHATSDARWSPDGRTIAVVLAGERVITIPAAGGRPKTIGRGLSVFWGRDGTLYVLRNTWSEVWTSTNGSPERFLLRAPGGLEIYSLDAD